MSSQIPPNLPHISENPPSHELLRIISRLNEKVGALEQLVSILESGKLMWESTFDAITSPVTIISSDYVIQRANLRLARVAEKDIRDVIGKHCYKVFADRKSPCENCPVAAAWQHDDQRSGRLAHAIHGRDFEVNAYPYAISKEKKRSSAVVYYRDITEEKRLQQEIVQQEKMAAIGILAGGVAHEINNPLGGILALVQLLLRDKEVLANESLNEDLNEIEAAALRCKKIVADLLEFSRSSSGKEKQMVDINAIIEKVIPFLKMELKSLNIESAMELAPHLPLIFGDGNRIQQVLLNFLTNACHAMKKGGILRVQSGFDKKSKFLFIAISDTGCGIASDHLDRIFDPFFTTKKPGEGTGLGLSISYRIIRDHGGTIDVSSKIDVGTTFTIKLPVRD